MNPPVQRMPESKLDLMMAGTKDAVLMIEGFADFLTEEQMVEAVAAGHAEIAKACRLIEEWAASVGKPKRSDGWVMPDGLAEKVGTDLGPRADPRPPLPKPRHAPCRSRRL